MAGSTQKLWASSLRRARTLLSRAPPSSREAQSIMRRILQQYARQRPECDAAMPLEALIFDVDRTLAETEEAHRRSFNEAFAAFGVDWSWDKELYRELLQVTGGKERLHHYIDAWKPRGSEVVLARFAELYDETSVRYAALVNDGCAPARPGVRRLITEAHERGIRLAIATTSLRESVEVVDTCVQAVDIDIIPIEAQAANLATGTIRLSEVAENGCRKAEIDPFQVIAWRRENGQTGRPRRLDSIFRIFN